MSVSPPVAPAPVGAPVSVFKKIGRAFLAAITSPTAVKEEKSLVVFVAVRLLQAAGAGGGLVLLAQALVK